MPSLRTLPLIALLFAAPAWADERWSLSAEALAMSSPSLPDIVLGGMIEGRLHLSSAVHVSAKLGGGYASDSNETWVVAQTYLIAMGGIGVSKALGRARLSADLHVGALFVPESDQRQQYQQLVAANLPNLTQSSYAAGPLADIALSIDLQIYRQWFFRVCLGPTATYLSVNGETRFHGGIFSGIGVSLAY